MIYSYLLLNVISDKEHFVYNDLIKVSGISDITLLYGEYDIIAKLSADSYDQIGDLFLNNIKKIDGINKCKILTTFAQ